MSLSENMASSAKELNGPVFAIYPKGNFPDELPSASCEQTIKEFVPASWFHPVGIFKVLARFWDRLPDVSGKLFLTFTLDPKNYANEETAFEDSRDWLRKVFYQLRHGVEADTTSLALGERSHDWQPGLAFKPASRMTIT
jgi:hypothetical protein